MLFFSSSRTDIFRQTSNVTCVNRSTLLGIGTEKERARMNVRYSNSFPHNEVLLLPRTIFNLVTGFLYNLPCSYDVIYSCSALFLHIKSRQINHQFRHMSFSGMG